MNTKLTLQLNKDVIEMAKFYARSKQTSLSILRDYKHSTIAVYNAEEYLASSASNEKP